MTLSHNIFAYCLNNSINMKDDTGFMTSQLKDFAGGWCDERSSDPVGGGAISNSTSMGGRFKEFCRYASKRLKYGCQGTSKG